MCVIEVMNTANKLKMATLRPSRLTAEGGTPCLLQSSGRDPTPIYYSHLGGTPPPPSIPVICGLLREDQSEDSQAACPGFSLDRWILMKGTEEARHRTVPVSHWNKCKLVHARHSGIHLGRRISDFKGKSWLVFPSHN